MAARHIITPGTVFGHLTAVRQFWRDAHTVVLCRCDCGKEKVIRSEHLLSGCTISCGHIKARGARLRHGHAHTRIYFIWNNMRRRCQDPNNKRFSSYGGRGIRVCDRWNIFDNFLADMGERPIGKSLDRINNDGNYEPSNCRWTDAATQATNTSRNVFLEYQGTRMTISQWADAKGLKRGTLQKRIYSGWSIENALTASLRAGCPERNRAHPIRSV